MNLILVSFPSVNFDQCHGYKYHGACRTQQLG